MSVKPTRPSARDDLLRGFGLAELAASVARQDAETGVKRKLRKSYKNHIADLPGKHIIPARGETRWSLSELARQPEQPLQIANLNPELLAQLRFEKTPASGLPGFDPKWLATIVPQPNEPQVFAAASPTDRKDRKKRRSVASIPPEKRRKV